MFNIAVDGIDMSVLCMQLQLKAAIVSKCNCRNTSDNSVPFSFAGYTGYPFNPPAHVVAYWKLGQMILFVIYMLLCLLILNSTARRLFCACEVDRSVLDLLTFG